MERIHIAFFGPTNSGKSTLVNTIAGQPVSLVSDVPGTTTDPVRKLIELPGLGPCVLIDTAGLDDASVLGAERRRLTLSILDETDVAVYVWPNAVDAPDSGTSSAFADMIRSADIPVVSYSRGETVADLLRRIAAAVPKQEERFLTGNLVKSGDTVLLVMPQDSEAPKGRLILPQVQVLRELLDRRCNALCCTPDTLPDALARLKETPDLVITDASVFRAVDAALPAGTPLTAFSVLLAAAKGDIRTFVEGARAIDTLRPDSRVLIAEACTHVPDTEDIGRVKIPALLRKRMEMPGQAGHDSLLARHDTIKIVIAAGNAFPEDLSPYDLIIHCGACMATGRVVRARTRRALLAGVPITNYGIALAKLQGILDRIVIPG
jgi:Predicted GTPases